MLNNSTNHISARVYNSGFALAHDTYNAITVASNGLVYYILSSQSIDTGGMMYSFEPLSGRTTLCGDITEACGEKGSNAIPQGKSHVRFVESDGKLYFATHAGYYSLVDGMERMGIPLPGYLAYPGGHFLSYDLHTGLFENLAIAPFNEGILTMNMDTGRGVLYAITWPTGYFISCDIKNRQVKNFGPVSGAGESGAGSTFRALCRAIAINAVSGKVYLTNSSGDILCYTPGADKLLLIEENMRKDYFGQYDPATPGHMGYNWRQINWCATDNSFYGVHGNSGYLFRFDPITETITILDRITSAASKSSGMVDQFSYGYLGLMFGPDNSTLYYLTGSPIYAQGKRLKGKDSTAKGEAKGEEDLHLITYDTRTNKYYDHGAIFYEDGQRPLYVNAIAIGKDGTIYTLARVTENGVTRSDLIRIPFPLQQL